VGLSAAAWIAIGAACVAVVALGLCAFLFVQLRRLRSNQLVLLGGGKDDLVDFAVSLQAGSITNTSLVRYDAYEGAGGHQSATIALLDASRTGVVVSAIQGRDYARIYVKELERGQPNVALSPEEQAAVEKAMAG
jgi:hypothetical protein